MWIGRHCPHYRLSYRRRLQKQDVLRLEADGVDVRTVIHRLHGPIRAYQGRARGPVVVEEFGERVVEDAVARPVDGDPMARDPWHLVVVGGPAWRSG